MQRRSVDLPEPEGPITQTTSPLGISMSMPRSTSSLPKRLHTPSRRMISPSVDAGGWLCSIVAMLDAPCAAGRRDRLCEPRWETALIVARRRAALGPALLPVDQPVDQPGHRE